MPNGDHDRTESQRTAEAVHQAIVKLSPWSHHHPTCARNTHAEVCDCGLQATLQEIDPRVDALPPPLAVPAPPNTRPF
jgi:hypothetical protein